jgi:hypothetical protein
MNKVKELEKDILELISKFNRETNLIPTNIKLDIANRKGHKAILGCYIDVIKNERV